VLSAILLGFAFTAMLLMYVLNHRMKVKA